MNLAEAERNGLVHGRVRKLPRAERFCFHTVCILKSAMRSGSTEDQSAYLCPSKWPRSRISPRARRLVRPVSETGPLADRVTRHPRPETKNLYPRYMRRGIPADLQGQVRREGPGARNFRRKTTALFRIFTPQSDDNVRP